MKKKYSYLLLLLLIPFQIFAQWNDLSGLKESFEKVKFSNASIGYAVTQTSITKTSDGGVTWNTVHTPANTIFLALDVLGTDTIYAAGYNFTNSAGLIYKSVNAGASWTSLTISANMIQSMEVVTPLIAYAGTSDGKVMKTINGGSTWTTTNTGISYSVENIFFLNSTTGYIISTGVSFSRVLKTTNGGTNWSLLNAGVTSYYFGLFCLDVNTLFITGSSGLIRKSIDGGTNWTAYTPATSEDLTNIVFTDASTAYITGTNSTVLKSIDAGDNWSPQATGIFYGAEDISVVNTNTLYINSGYRLFKTTNAGANWNSIFIILPTLNTVFFTDATTGYAAGDLKSIYKTADGGVSWTEVPTPSITASGYEKIHFTNTNVGYAITNTVVMKTTDAGLTWNASSTGISGTIQDLYFVDDNNGYATSGSGAVYKTVNAGASWTTHSTGSTEVLLGVFFTDVNTGYVVGTAGAILKTTNAGANWTPQTSVFTSTLQKVYFESSTTGYIVGTFGRIQKTTNGGTSWTSQTSNAGTSTLNDVYFTGANVGFVVAQGERIQATTDGGTTWFNQYLNGSSTIILNGVHFPTSGIGYAVGGQGKILKHIANEMTNVVVSGSTFCAGSNVSVTFQKVSTFNGANVFTAQLSDNTGSFASPVNIGSSSASPISATIPAASVSGTGYLIRVVSSNPAVTGESSSAITVNALPAVNAGSNQSICANASAFTMTGFSPAGGTWSGTGVNAGGLFTPQKSMAGSVVTLTYSYPSGGCTGTDTKDITLSLPTAVITPASNMLTATAGGGYQYQWLFNGTSISGATGQTYITTQVGNHSVRVYDGTCIDTSAQHNVTSITDFFPRTSGTTNWLKSVHFPSSTTGYAVGQSGTVLTTTNAGQTWTSQTSGTINHIYSVHFPSTTVGVFVGNNVVKRYSAGTWVNPTSSGTNEYNSVHFPTTTRGYMRGATNVGQLSSDGGTNWSNFTATPAFYATSVFFTSSTTGYVVGVNGAIAKTTNSGASLVAQTSGSVYDLHCVHFPSASIGYVVGSAGTILKTTNGGTNWTTQSSGTTQNLRGVYFTDTNTGYAVGELGTTLKTLDGGAHWYSLVSGTTQALRGVHFPIASEGYVVGDGGTILKYLVPSNEVAAVTASISLICAGSTFDLSFITNGTFNAGNTFTIEMSDGNGSFSSPVSLGSSASNPTGTSLLTANGVAIPAGTPAGTGYRFRVRSSNPAIVSYASNANVEVKNGIPAITTQPINQTINYNQGTWFNVVNSQTGVTYQWEVNTGSGFSDIVNGGIYSNATTATLNLTGVLSTMSGYQYRCKLTNICGTQTSSTVTLTVNCPLPVINAQPEDFYTSEGVVYPFPNHNAKFQISATGSSISYQWQQDVGTGFTNITNGGVYSGATSNTLYLAQVYLGNNGYKYHCVVSSVCGSVNSSEAILTVHPKIFTEIFTDQIHDFGTSEKLEWGDYDNDGDLDVLSMRNTQGDGWSKLYANTPTGFVEEYTGMISNLLHGRADWGDYDNDGRLDLLMVGGIYASDNSMILHKNAGYGFDEVYTGSLTPLQGSTSSCAWGDFDNDGDQDIVINGENGTSCVAKLYENTGSGFVEVYPGTLSGGEIGSVEWGDYDNDGDLDLLLTGGELDNDIYKAKIYQNTGSGFTEVYAGSLTGVSGVATWGDYDADGDLDIFLSGDKNIYQSGDVNSDPVSKLYQNTGSGFVEVYVGDFENMYGRTANWGDIDNDGLLDILISSASNLSSNTSTKIYRNVGNGFIEVYQGQIGDVSSASWADIDNDGDLDIVANGGTFYAKIYRNDLTVANNIPVAPGNLTSSVFGNDVTLSWDKTTDTETVQDGLTYNIMVGTTLHGYEKVSPLSDETGYRKVVKKGNVDQNQSWTIKDLSPGIYYWSVQAIDNGCAGSPFASSGAFSIGNTVPVILTNTPSTITGVSAVSGGDILTDGGSSILSKGVCWSTIYNPTIANSKTLDGTGSADFSSNIAGLLPNTTYYVRAYATNSTGTAYGEVQTFVTPLGSAVIPDTKTISLISIHPNPTSDFVFVQINSNQPSCEMTITNDGGALMHQEKIEHFAGNERKIYVGNLAQGYYNLEISFTSGETSVQRFFVVR